VHVVLVLPLNEPLLQLQLVGCHHTLHLRRRGDADAVGAAWQVQLGGTLAWGLGVCEQQLGCALVWGLGG
jgi:hypothetical protein